MSRWIGGFRSVEKARAFLNPTAVAEASKAAGVLDFEWHFVESIEGYTT
jgi:hypothetical protein